MDVAPFLWRVRDMPDQGHATTSKAPGKAQAWMPLALSTKARPAVPEPAVPWFAAPVGPVGRAKAKALGWPSPVPLRTLAEGVPGPIPVPPAALPDHQRHSEGECKCYDVWFDNLRDLKGWEAMEHITQAHTYRARRCQFVLRTSGCRKGDQCEYCHVHGVDEKQEKHWQKLPKREREEYWLNKPDFATQVDEAVSTALTCLGDDRRGYLNYGYPVGGIHNVILGVHRLL
jgi:hypothetical protein